MWLKPFFHTLVLLIRQARANHVGPVNKYTLNTFKWIQCKLITAGVISSTVAEYRLPCSTFLLSKVSGVERTRLWISWGRTSMLLAEGWCRLWEQSLTVLYQLKLFGRWSAAPSVAPNPIGLSRNVIAPQNCTSDERGSTSSGDSLALP